MESMFCCRRFKSHTQWSPPCVCYCWGMGLKPHRFGNSSLLMVWNMSFEFRATSAEETCRSGFARRTFTSAVRNQMAHRSLCWKRWRPGCQLWSPIFPRIANGLWRHRMDGSRPRPQSRSLPTGSCWLPGSAQNSGTWFRGETVAWWKNGRIGTEISPCSWRCTNISFPRKALDEHGQGESGRFRSNRYAGSELA